MKGIEDEGDAERSDQPQSMVRSWQCRDGMRRSATQKHANCQIELVQKEGPEELQ